MKHRFGMVAVAAGLALSLTGCLGGDGEEKAAPSGQAAPASAAQVISRTADKAGEVTSLSTDLQTKSQLGEGSLDMKMSLAMQFKPELLMRLKTEPVRMAGLSISGMDAVMTKDAMFMKAVSKKMLADTGGKPWGRVSIADLSTQSGTNIQDLVAQSRQSNPVDQVKLMTASKDVKEIGPEAVDGVQTTKYVGTVDLTEALGKVDGETRAALEKQYRALGADTMTFELWIDGDGLPRKMTSSLNAQKLKIDTTAVYRDYNQPVNVQVPDPSQYADIKLG